MDAFFGWITQDDPAAKEADAGDDPLQDTAFCGVIGFTRHKYEKSGTKRDQTHGSHPGGLAPQIPVQSDRSTGEGGGA
jgi:hypothetical protein